MTRIFFSLVLVIFLFFFQSTHSFSALYTKKLPSEILSQIQVGDFIFRKGLDGDSEFIAYLSHSDFSHIGMIVSINPIQIIHATTNDNSKHKNQVIISPLSEFLHHSQYIAVKRLNLSKEKILKIKNEALKYLGRNFVLSADEKRLYCTTFLEKAIQTQMDFEVKYTYVNVPFLKGDYLFPQAFWQNEEMIEIVKIVGFQK